MVKKMKSTSTEGSTGNSTGAHAGSSSSPLASSVKESAQQIWLAGMGAFSKAQEEGTKVFEALVKEGMSLQKKTQGMAEEKLGEVTGKMSAMADTVTSKAGQNWDKLEAIFEARTAKAMAKLGVPTAKEVAALADRIDALSAQVAKLGKGTTTAARSAPTKAEKAEKAVRSAKTVKAPKAVAAEAAPAAKKVPVKRARKTAMI